MSFSNVELRRGMDVFSVDGVLLGSVVQIRRRPRALTPSTEQTPGDASTDTFNGESLGPMPTTALGNGGPAHQRRSARFGTATRPETALAVAEPTDILVFRTLVHLDWSTLWPTLRRYPVSLIQHVSHERITLSVTAAELDSQ